MESVLLVNGPPAERKIHREVLERAGYPVKEVLALDMALRSAREEHPLAVILECAGRPELQHRFVASLRGHPATVDVPVLLVLSEPTAEGLFADAPAVGSIAEHCTPRELLEELAYLTRSKDVHRSEGARPTHLEPTPRPPAPPSRHSDSSLGSGHAGIDRDTGLPFAPRPPLHRN